MDSRVEWEQREDSRRQAAGGKWEVAGYMLPSKRGDSLSNNSSCQIPAISP